MSPPDLRRHVREGGSNMAEFNASPVKKAPSPVEGSLTPMNAASASPRELLVRKLVDIVVLPAARISGNARSLAADILVQLLNEVEEALRIEVARRAGRTAECPPALLRMLLLDDAAVAAHVIESAERLPEALLIETARDASAAHRMMIAQRLDLTAAVADACLLYDELDVCRVILRRGECQLSPNAVNRLVAMSAICADLQAPLLRRPELEPAHGFTMFWWVAAEHRRRIIARFSLDRTVIQDALADLYPRAFRTSEPDPLVQEILVLAERRHRPRGLDGETVSMEAVKRTLALALKEPTHEIIDATAMIGGVSHDLSSRILRDPGGEAFAVLCKSLGLSRDDFYAFYDDPADPELRVRGEYLQGFFDGMARDFARAIIRYWDWDGNPRIAHITNLLGLMRDDVSLTGAY